MEYRQIWQVTRNVVFRAYFLGTEREHAGFGKPGAKDSDVCSSSVGQSVVLTT